MRDRVEQRAGRPEVEAAELERGQILERDHPLGRVPHGEDDRDAVGFEPPGDEGEHRERLLIEPLPRRR